MAESPVAFLGPEGTFAHLVAQKRFHGKNKLVPLPTIDEVFDFVAGKPSARGIVPIENSSGGTIYDTIDRLVDHTDVLIEEALSLNVRLALLGKSKENLRVIYSHFAPLHHCEPWIDRHFPGVEVREVSSTAKALITAAEEPGAAAIGNRQASGIYKLKILEFPIEQDIPNVTQFLLLGHRTGSSEAESRTTLAVTLPNAPGSLCDFLQPFKDNQINLTRIISRPIVGKPNSYVFLVDLKGAMKSKGVSKALAMAKPACASLRLLGSYPVRKSYSS